MISLTQAVRTLYLLVSKCSGPRAYFYAIVCVWEGVLWRSKACTHTSAFLNDFPYSVLWFQLALLFPNFLWYKVIYL